MRVTSSSLFYFLSVSALLLMWWGIGVLSREEMGGRPSCTRSVLALLWGLGRFADHADLLCCGLSLRSVHARTGSRSPAPVLGDVASLAMAAPQRIRFSNGAGGSGFPRSGRNRGRGVHLRRDRRALQRPLDPGQAPEPRHLGDPRRTPGIGGRIGPGGPPGIVRGDGGCRFQALPGLSRYSAASEGQVTHGMLYLAEVESSVPYPRWKLRRSDWWSGFRMRMSRTRRYNRFLTGRFWSTSAKAKGDRSGSGARQATPL